jgi:hypothetical protein
VARGQIMRHKGAQGKAINLMGFGNTGLRDSGT